MFSFAKIDIQKRKFLKLNQTQNHNYPNIINQLKIKLKIKGAMSHLFEFIPPQIVSVIGITGKLQFITSFLF